MPDMIVRLYDLPNLEEATTAIAAHGIVVRRVLPQEQSQLTAWVATHFEPWVPEVEVTYTHKPTSCFIALSEEKLLGFAAYEATCKNYFGPTGVAPEHRGKGIGKALLLSALHAQRDLGYAYSIIGGVGPAEYYAKMVDAQLIDKSTPGIYGAAATRSPSND